MDIREKLVELLHGAQKAWGDYMSEWWTDGERPIKDYWGIFADHLLANNVTVQEWISVTERLPQDMQERVLVTTDCDTPVGNQKIDTDRFRRGEWVRYGSHVTHWMPLPLPPKGE